MSSAQAAQLVSQRYAEALIELAEESKTLSKVEKDRSELGAMISKSEDLRAVLDSPLIDKKALSDSVNAIAAKAKFQKTTTNFLNVLVQNGRLSVLPQILQTFFASLAKRQGVVEVDVTVAQDLTAKQKKDLEAALSKSVGKNVAIRLKVEPSILGGMIVTVGSKMIDDSVARKLERLKLSLGVQANENSQNSTNLSEVV